jgi:hypothetical protein
MNHNIWCTVERSEYPLTTIGRLNLSRRRQSRIDKRTDELIKIGFDRDEARTQALQEIGGGDRGLPGLGAGGASRRSQEEREIVDPRGSSIALYIN